MIDLYWDEVPESFCMSADKWLSAYRREKLARLRVPSLAQASVGAELLLIRALKDRLGEIPLPLEIDCDKQGKPYLTDHEIQFNLSHSGRYAACALGEMPLGVDIQLLRSYSPELIRRCFTTAEQRMLMESPEPERTFVQLWTRKESLLKAVGIGLRAPLSGLDVSGADPVVSFQGESYVFWEQSFTDGQICLCCPARPEKEFINCVKVELPD